MNDQDHFEEQAAQHPDIEEAFNLPGPLPRPLPVPLLPLISGLYEWTRRSAIPAPVPPAPGKPIPVLPQDPQPGPLPTPTSEADSVALIPFWFEREELRLDVDGRYPQMIASGTASRLLSVRIHWIANLTSSARDSWTGTIWYKDGDVSSFPYTTVAIRVTRSWFPNQRRATVTFSGTGTPDRVLTYMYKSPYFHSVEFEFDSAQGTTAVTTVQTHAHPNRPAGIRNETLSIEKVYQRTGFDVKKSGGDNPLPLSLAGADVRWSDMEMHDAMQTYWSRFAGKAQWSMWVFFAALHESGTSLGGIMFDDIGPNHRQGTSIFNDSFVSNAPAGDPNPAAWVQRMRFWTACHEMGHSFNLAHSWDKEHPPSWGTPWIPLVDEPEARSFMNYPYNVAGGQTAFFSDFEYRFSEGELLFMRHAPARFVQMGNADWFDNHGFQQASISPEPAYKLELRTNRERPLFEFMEPVVVELKLTNMLSHPQLIHENLLSMLDRMTVILRKDGKPARQFIPYAQYCWQSGMRMLNPGESVYESLFISVGRNGWDMAEPGYYTVQVALHHDKEDIVSSQLRIRVTPPRGYDEEYLAQDFFSDDVGRVITFDGSRFLSKGNDILSEVVARLGDRRVARHVRVALGSAIARDCKQLDLGEGSTEPMPAHMVGGKIKLLRGNTDDARKQLSGALAEQTDLAAESLGHIDYKYYVDRYSDWLYDQGDVKGAVKAQDDLFQTLSARRVLDLVLRDIKGRRDRYKENK